MYKEKITNIQAQKNIKLFVVWKKFIASQKLIQIEKWF